MVQSEEGMKIFVVIHWPSPRESILLICVPVQREEKEELLLPIFLGRKQ